MCPLDVKRPSCEGFQPARVGETSAVVADLEERERWLENQNSLRGLRVRELLTSTEAIDIDGATASIQYPLRWHHLAVVMWYPERSGAGDELSRLQRFLRELAQAANAGAAPLFVAADQTSGWAWLPYRSAAPHAVETVRHFAWGRPNSPRLAIGAALPGVQGFRRSHRQAEAARGVAIAGGQRVPTLISATDPRLSAAAGLKPLRPPISTNSSSNGTGRSARLSPATGPQMRWLP